HDHESEIEAAEARGVKTGKSEIQGAAGGEQPDFVAVPNGTDGRDDGTTLRIIAGHKEVNSACAEIKTVEQDIGGQHDRHDAKPDCFHVRYTSCSFFVLLVLMMRECGLFEFRVTGPAVHLAPYQRQEKNAHERVHPHEAEE